MSSRSVVTLTTAPAGTGKSYRRCAHFLLTELLPQTTKRHISNFPIRFDAWESNGKQKRGLIEIARKYYGIKEEAIRQRVEVLPEEVVQDWRDGSSGPWDYFEDKDISGCHIAIDEIHNFCGSSSGKHVKDRWKKWLGEIRHRGATIEFISQHPEKIASQLKQEAEIRLSLVSGITRRDPFFRIEMGDWYQLKAMFTGKLSPAVFEIEKRMVDGKWINQNQVVFRFEDFMFETYDSFSAPIAGGERGELEKEPFERLGRAALVRWFFFRNLWPLTSRVIFLVVFVWMTAFGGTSYAIEGFTGMIKASAKSNTKQPEKGETGPGQPVPSKAGQGRGASPKRQAKVIYAQAGQAAASGPKPIEWEVYKEEINANVQRYRIVLVFPGGCGFRDGRRYRVGEIIDDGPYSGQRVDAVDMQRRAATIGARRLFVGAVDTQFVRKWSRDTITQRIGLGGILPAVSGGVEPGGRGSPGVQAQ